MDVTAVIITKNEEKNISDCINSIKGFAQRILVRSTITSLKHMQNNEIGQ